MFLFGSLFFLIFSFFSDSFHDTYLYLLMGFCMFYIIAVQHATLTFPRNRGGIYRIAADVSFILMLLGLSIRNFLIFKLGFLLFLFFQLLPMILYRMKIPRKNYDRVSYMFMLIGLVSGLLSVVLFKWKALIHSLFLGFELNMFLGCMAWMLPRFSKRVDDVGKAVYLTIPLSAMSLSLNIYAFLFGKYTLLKFAAMFMAITLLLFWLFFWKKFFSMLLNIGFLYFIIALYFAYTLNAHWHPKFMLSAMCIFTVLMGSRWVPLIAVSPIKKVGIWEFVMVILLCLFLYKIFALIFTIWAISKFHKSETFVPDTISTIKFYIKPHQKTPDL